MNTDAGEDKKASRRSARQARTAFVSALSPTVRQGLERALANIVIPHLGPPAILGTYAAMGDEIDPAAIEQAATGLGWRLAWPRVVGTTPLAFHQCDYDELQPGFRGILEPQASAPLVRPDVLLVPLLAVDMLGNRIGQGAGHYDRTLAELRSHGPAPVLAIGLAFDVQLVPSIPADRWDQPLDAIATPQAFHPAGPGAKRRG
jgi:5-formyltetrahydrofolate cyclo-ligase